MDIYDRSWQNGKDQTWRKAILLAKVHVCKLCLVYYTLSVKKVIYWQVFSLRYYVLWITIQFRGRHFSGYMMDLGKMV